MADVTDIDAVTLSVICARLESITDEMDATLFRTALSPVIADSHDASHGIYHPISGGAVAQGQHGHPIFVGVMSHAVSALLAHTKLSGLRHGDVYLTNDPWISGTHLQDMKAVAPVFIDGELFCFIAGSGHWTDMGGPVPGNWNPTATDFHHEGMRVPFVRIVADGLIQEDVLSIIMSNIRLAGWADSDLRSQLQVLAMGARRIGELCQEFGRETALASMDALIERTATMMRAEVAAIPDGVYSFTDHLDNDGINETPLIIEVAVVVNGDRLTLDFSGTSDRSPGPFNLSRPTFEAACFVALKHVFADLPANAGVMAPVDIIVPEKSLLNVEAPTAVGGYTEVSLRVIDALFGALAKAVPQNLWGASFGTVCSLVISGTEHEKLFVAFLYFGGGLGGCAEGDGLTHGPSALSNSYIASVELVEARFPLRFQQWSLRPDSGGDGQHRGGLGATYAIELLAPNAVSFFVGDRAVFPPFGVQGGHSAATTDLRYCLDGNFMRPKLKSKADNIQMSRGDVVVLDTPGGGGYGDPKERSITARKRDHLMGYVTKDLTGDAVRT